ncbi:unnamed protein product [Prunus armeniaca]
MNLDAKAKPTGNKSLTSYSYSPWVFKKPLKDITNSTVMVGGSNTDTNKVGSSSKKDWKNRVGAKPLNFLVVETFGMQDDVRGTFSFNVDGPFFHDPSLAKDSTFPEPEPPDDYNMEPIVGRKLVIGLEAGMPSYHDAPAAFEANVRGVGKNSCASTIKDLKKAFDIDILAVLEPRISGSRALTVAQNLGFSHYHIVDATGFSGGVWLLWNASSVSLQVVAHSSQSITVLVTLGNQWCLLTMVYVNPYPGIRESLWKYFDGLACASHLPWLVLGDFNDIASADEKCGGSLDQGGGSFIEWIDRNQLVDLGFSSAKFTWCNKRNVEGIIWKRLDRGLCNINWRLLFPEAHLSHLPRVNFDHYPVLVSLDSNHYPARDCTHFRFQEMWMSHPDFPKFIHANWSIGDGHASKKSARLKSSLISWNCQVFGCLF